MKNRYQNLITSTKFSTRSFLSVIGLCLLSSCATRKAPINESIAQKRAEYREQLGKQSNLAYRFGLNLIPHDSHSNYHGARLKKALNLTEPLTHEKHIDLLLQKANRPGVEKVLIFCHGGLNARSQSWQSGLEICEEIERTSNGKIFPIGITWTSGFLPTYWDRIAYERNGISYRKTISSLLRGTSGLLFHFPSHVATGVARFPRTASSAFENSLQNWDSAYQLSPQSFPVKYSFYQNLNNNFNTGERKHKRYQWDTGIDNLAKSLPNPRTLPPLPETPWFRTSMGRLSGTNYILGLQNLISSPVQYTALPLIDSIGRPAWENMSKRTASLVRPDLVNLYANKTGSPSDSKPVAYLFEQLCKRRSSIELELYGHSMGAMVFNEVVREIEAGRIHDPLLDRIVYMAAACSISDFNLTVGKYLTDHPKTNFHNLCLHPDCEIRETFQKFPLINLAIPGSLLVWIDTFYENPDTPLDRTLGSYVNVITNWRHLPRTSNFTVKAFGMQLSERHKERTLADGNWIAPESEEYNAGPQKHGDFKDFHFWESEYYLPKETEIMPAYARFR